MSLARRTVVDATPAQRRDAILGHLPDTWSVFALSRVTLSRCDGPFGSGLKSESYSDTGRRVVRLQNIGSADFLDADSAFIDEEYYRNVLGDHDVQPGDLLVAGLGDESHPVGRACVAPADLGPAMVKADCFRFRLDQRRAVPRFFAYQLSETGSSFSRAMSTGTTRSRVNLSRMASRRVAAPPIQTQAAIADFLDRETEKIDALVARKQQLVELLKEKRTALISHAVTKGLDPDVPMKDSGVEWLGEIPSAWHMTPLKRLLVSIEQGWSPQCEERQKEEDEWGVLKAGCANGGKFRASEHKALPSTLEPDTSLEVHEGDVLMSRANTRYLVGSAAFVDATPSRLLLCDKLYRLRPRVDSLEPKYVACYLGSRVSRHQLERDATGASDSMQNTSQAAVRSLAFPAPPLSEQRRIVAALDVETARLRELTSLTELAVTRLREYRSALITAAVTGQIDVRDYAKKAS